MKRKTNKSAKKRFLVSSTGKIKRRPVKQGHFNARATGDQTRKKHGSEGISKSDKSRVRDLLPYS